MGFFPIKTAMFVAILVATGITQAAWREVASENDPYPLGQPQTTPGPQRFKLETATVTLDVGEGWEGVPNLYSLPVVVLGPDRSHPDPADTEDFHARRSSFAVVPTGAENVELIEEGLAREQNQHFANRARDLGALGGKVIEKIPYQFVPAKDAKDTGWRGLHRIGLRFQMQAMDAVEVSYYVSCGGQLFLLKAMIHQEDRAADFPVIEAMARSFRCR